MQSVQIENSKNHTGSEYLPDGGTGYAPEIFTAAAPNRDRGQREGLLDQLDGENMRLHVTILGWLYVVGNGMLLLIGGFVFTFLSGIGTVVDDPQAFAVLSIMGTTVGILLGVLALPGVVAGYGLLRGREWGRILGLVTAIISLINVPLGTLIGLYALWVLLQKESALYFGQAAVRKPSTFPL